MAAPSQRLTLVTFLGRLVVRLPNSIFVSEIILVNGASTPGLPFNSLSSLLISIHCCPGLEELQAS